MAATTISYRNDHLGGQFIVELTTAGDVSAEVNITNPNILRLHTQRTGASTFTVTLEGSMDCVNWVTLGTTSNAASTSQPTLGPAVNYIRANCVANGGVQTLQMSCGWTK